MQIVIDIPEETYDVARDVYNGMTLSIDSSIHFIAALCCSICKGEILPDEHGNLVDVEEAKSALSHYQFESHIQARMADILDKRTILVQEVHEDAH